MYAARVIYSGQVYRLSCDPIRTGYRVPGLAYRIAVSHRWHAPIRVRRQVWTLPRAWVDPGEIVPFPRASRTKEMHFSDRFPGSLEALPPSRIFTPRSDVFSTLYYSDTVYLAIDLCPKATLHLLHRTIFRN